MMAPVVGSGSCPAWMARVAKPARFARFASGAVGMAEGDSTAPPPPPGTTSPPPARKRERAKYLFHAGEAGRLEDVVLDGGDDRAVLLGLGARLLPFRVVEEGVPLLLAVGERVPG